MKDPKVIKTRSLVLLVREIQFRLWQDGPETEWDADTASDIAGILIQHGLGPDDNNGT